MRKQAATASKSNIVKRQSRGESARRMDPHTVLWTDDLLTGSISHDMITKTEAEIMRSTHLSNNMPMNYPKFRWYSPLSWDCMYAGNITRKYFTERLQYSIHQSMRSCWGPDKHAAVQDPVHHVLSIANHQEVSSSGGRPWGGDSLVTWPDNRWCKRTAALCFETSGILLLLSTAHEIRQIPHYLWSCNQPGSRKVPPWESRFLTWKQSHILWILYIIIAYDYRAPIIY